MDEPLMVDAGFVAKPIDPIAVLKKSDQVTLRMDNHWKPHGSINSCDTEGLLVRGSVNLYSCFKPHYPSCPPAVLFCSSEGAFSWMGRFNPEQARELAAALLRAADVVEPLLVQWESIVY